jgi:predicted extracellular nuclease
MDESLISVAFYNVENLFDTEDNKHTLDKDFTPKGKKKWGPYRYQLKVKKIGKAISKIGNSKCYLPPVLVGLAEVENKNVLDDLLKSDDLQFLPYDYIHYDSPDERGIDVALLYNKNEFKVLESKSIPVLIYEKNEVRDYTRDILYVKGILNGEIVHVYVNHWPSKRNGYDETRLKRIDIANMLHSEIAQLEEENPKIIIMGDFNDNPNDESIKGHLTSNGIINPSALLFLDGQGTSKFYGEWMLFDQILISNNLVQDKKLQYKDVHIFKDDFLLNPKGRFKGEPFRTYSGKYYLGGYSDHFPIYILLERK